MTPMQNVIKYLTQNVITFLTHTVITQNVIQVGTRSQSAKYKCAWHGYSSVFKQVIGGDRLGLQRGGSSLKIRHLGRAETFLFPFVSRERVCLLGVQVRFPLNM